MNTVPPINSHYHGDPTSEEHGLFIKQPAEMILFVQSLKKHYFSSYNLAFA